MERTNGAGVPLQNLLANDRGSRKPITQLSRNVLETEATVSNRFALPVRSPVESSCSVYGIDIVDLLQQIKLAIYDR